MVAVLDAVVAFRACSGEPSGQILPFMPALYAAQRMNQSVSFLREFAGILRRHR